MGELTELLSRGEALALTGAGMSTDSGIPDYRGPDGRRRVAPMHLQEFVASAEARQRYWARSFVGWRRFAQVQPNAAHHAVTALQGMGVIGPVITQNVDRLHQAAGTCDVVDLHGTLAEVVCLDCDDRSARADLDARMAGDNPGFAVEGAPIRPDGDAALDAVEVAGFVVPRCLRCGGDRLKPDVVFFGGAVEKPVVEACFAMTERASALLVLGSSLQVMSGLRFVRRAHRLGIPVGIVTRGPTRADDLATVRVDAGLSATLEALVEALLPRGAGVTAAAAPP